MISSGKGSIDLEVAWRDFLGQLKWFLSLGGGFMVYTYVKIHWAVFLRLTTLLNENNLIYNLVGV